MLYKHRDLITSAKEIAIAALLWSLVVSIYTENKPANISSFEVDSRVQLIVAAGVAGAVTAKFADNIYWRH